jgi:hypothetical protein
MNNSFVKNKFNLLLCGLLFTLVGFLVSCQKDTETVANTETQNIQPEPPTNCSNAVDEKGIWDLLSEEDAENTMISRVNYHFANAAKELLLIPDVKSAIVSKVNSDQRSEFGIIEFLNDNPQYKNIVETKLTESLQAHPYDNCVYTDGMDVIPYLVSRLKHGEYEYRPIIYSVIEGTIPSETASFNVALPFAANDCDMVPAWIGENEILLTEDIIKESLASTPVIFVGHGEKRTSYPSKVSGGEIVDLKATQRTIPLNVTSWQIKAGSRFDNTTYSDVWQFSVIYNRTTKAKVGSVGSLMVKQHKNLIDNSVLCNTPTIPHSSFFPNADIATFDVFSGFWENDWYASKKSIDNTCESGFNDNTTGPDVSANMFNSGEDYGAVCGTGSNLSGTGLWQSVGSFQLINNTKARFVITRGPTTTP